MSRELYQVEVDCDGRKVVHYNGYIWGRQAGHGDFDEAGRPLDYAITEGAGCRVPIAGNEGRLEEAVMEAFECVQQYQGDICREDYLEAMEEWGSCPRLHLDEVTLDTPEGMYHYDAS